MIRIVREKITCGICGENDAVMYCGGCDVALCREGCRLDLFAHDCGSVDPLVLCPSCAEDIDLNPWGGKRPG